MYETLLGVSICMMCVRERLIHCVCFAASYDIVTVVGSHAVNHIKSEALYEMIRLTKPGKWYLVGN